LSTWGEAGTASHAGMALYTPPPLSFKIQHTPAKAQPPAPPATPLSLLLILMSTHRSKCSKRHMGWNPWGRLQKKT